MGNRNWSRVEEPGELQLCLSPAVDIIVLQPPKHQRARGLGLSCPVEIRAVHDPYRQQAAFGGFELDVDRVDAFPSGPWCDTEQELLAVDGGNVFQFQCSFGDLLQIKSEPRGKRCVQIDDSAIGIGREKTGRCVIEIADNELQPRKGALLPLPVEANVSQPPERINLTEA